MAVIKVVQCVHCAHEFEAWNTAKYCSDVCRLEARRAISGDCWIWSGRTTDFGYGVVALPQRTSTYAHRLAYKTWVADIPDDMEVCHQCDVPSCFNPAHLFLGTPADNALDRVLKKRQAFGERHWKSRLTEKDVFAIRRDRRTNKAVAAAYNVGVSTIANIRAGHTWRYVQ